MTNISVTFEYSEKETVEEIKKHIIRSPITKLRVVFTTLTYIMAAYYLWKDYHYVTTIMFVTLGSILLITLIHSIYLKPSKSYQRNKELYGERTAKFTEDGINIDVKDYSDTKYNWNYFSKMSEIDDYYLLWLSRLKNKYVIIPKRVFKDEAEQQAFKELVSRKLS